jgi:uncharacterized protein YndB with AHSA1/START domain
MPNIMHLIKIHASPERVYQALTTAESIRNWWTRDAVLDSRIGGTGEFRFHDGKSVIEMRIDELKPPVRVVWKTISCFRPEWDGTTVAFDLQAEGSDTALSFAHRDFAQADEGYALVTRGWAYYLVSLQQYLETGKGAPHPDKDLACVVK